MIQAPIQMLDKEARVSAIINQEANWRNIPLIEQIFPAETVEQICSIAICPQLMPDKLIWASSTTRLFIVRRCLSLGSRPPGPVSRKLLDESITQSSLENYLASANSPSSPAIYLEGVK
jgi:hypothetical protein